MVCAFRLPSARLRLLQLVVCVSGTMVTASALADWSEAGRSEDFVYYVDLQTMKRTGNIRRVWTLLDSTAPNAAFRSARVLEEYNCAEESSRVLQFQSYDGPKGSGQAKEGLAQTTPWSFVAPDTIEGQMLKSVCSN
jgi:hypothetical protein